MSKKNDNADSASDKLQLAIAESLVPMALMIEGEIFYTNHAFIEHYGKSMGKTFADFFEGKSQDQLHWLIARAQGEVDKIVLPLRENIKSEHAGSEVMVQIWPVAGECILFSLQSDYSVSRLADLDELTRLPNRRKAAMLLDIERSLASRTENFYLSLADIDHFKSINDTFGHDAGDAVLKQVAQTMTSLMREGDWVARWGGEEFLIYINNGDLVTAIQPVERIRSALESMPIKEIDGAAVTMSFGLAPYDEEKGLDDLLSRADSLLYDAKRKGRNRIEYPEKEVVWTAENIRGAISEGKVLMETLPVYDWSGEVAMSQVVPRLRGRSWEDTQYMLESANRLSEQILVDRALMEVVLDKRYEKKGNDKLYFPIHQRICVQHDTEVVEFLQRLPTVQVGVHPDGMLPDNIVSMLGKSNRSLVLHDYDAKKSSPFLLGMRGLSSVVFSDEHEIEGVIALLKGNGIKCYVQLSSPPTAQDRARLKRKGFDGWQKVFVEE